MYATTNKLTSDISVKEDNRGRHWKAKVADGNAPEPWKHTKDWADKRSTLEATFCALISSMKISYVLPWRRPTAMHRTLGN